MRKILLYGLIFLVHCYSNLSAQSTVLIPDQPKPSVQSAQLTFDAHNLKLRQRLQVVFRSYMGVKEATGNNDGELVESFLAAVGLGRGNPWCAAFVKYCFDQVGVKTTITAWSPTATPPARRIWQEGKVIKRLPTFGDVFSIYYPNLKRIGHTGFVDEWKEDSPYVSTCEGNTNAQNSREGNGGFYRKRLKRQVYAVADWIE